MTTPQVLGEEVKRLADHYAMAAVRDNHPASSTKGSHSEDRRLLRAAIDRLVALAAPAAPVQPLAIEEMRQRCESIAVRYMALAMQMGAKEKARTAGSIADEIKALAAHPSAPAQPDPLPSDVVPSMPQYWQVEVIADGESLVSIGHNWLSGSRPLEQQDEQTIIGAARHLLAFVGYGLPESSFDPDEAEGTRPEGSKP